MKQHPQIILKASTQELQMLLNLLNQANTYSVTLSGKPAWIDIPKAYKSIKEQLNFGNIFIIRDNNGNISSAITICNSSDEWSEIGKDGKALYFTKLMKDPQKAQTNEAVKLLNFAAKQAKRENKEFLRCDALNDPLGIVAYYKKLGFRERGFFIYESIRREGVLLEIKIGKDIKSR